MLKKMLFLVISCLLCFGGLAQADNLFNATPATILFDTVTPATSAAVNLGYMTTKITCHISISAGTAPTSVLVGLQGSIDNVTYGTLTIGTGTSATFTVADATTNSFSVMYQPIQYLKGVYTSKVGGDGTTKVKLVCGAGGN